MKRVVLIIAVLSLAITGCMNSGERFATVEKNIETIMARLDSIESRIDMTEKRQTVVEEYYNEMTAKKADAQIQVPSSPLSTQAIQNALKNAGFYTGAIDGKMGPGTFNSIKSFQQANGLKPDGVVGAKTMALLKAHITKEAPAAPQPQQ